MHQGLRVWLAGTARRPGIRGSAQEAVPAVDRYGRTPATGSAASAVRVGSAAGDRPENVSLKAFLPRVMHRV
ncbi:hypothetical protein GCM10010425_14410 [Streptomyces spororaveus]|uniref:Uncharacterized protein n=1 Tax=Streptomyces spororaveus TaxID=284039 RepID=A0ABQ3T5E4_9ACTN|nr:hypothetical protein Sspor_11530 [Streptomyces spororaveus]